MTLATQATLARTDTWRDRVEAAAVTGARNVYTEATTLNANLASGVATTSIPVTPNLGSTIANGTVINVGGETAVVATSGGTSGAAAITVTSFTPTRSHFIGETVTPPTPTGHLARAVLATNIMRTPDAYREVFAWAVSSIEDGNAAATDAAIANDVSAVWNDIAGA